jgi:hypothetical protein
VTAAEDLKFEGQELQNVDDSYEPKNSIDRNRRMALKYNTLALNFF